MDMTNCPECGEPAEVYERHVLESTDGPIEHARVRCVRRHFFFMQVSELHTPRPLGVPRRSRSAR